MDTDTQRKEQLNFMAVLTLIMVLTVQISSLVALWKAAINYSDYLALWTPLMGIAIGYWFRDLKG